VNLRQFHRVLRIVLIAPIAALLLMAAGLFLQMKGAHDSVKLIQAADEDIAETIRVEELIMDEEASLRGYQITGDPTFLQPYLDAQPQIEHNLKALETSPASTGTGAGRQTDRIRAVSNAQQAWKESFAEPLIATIQAGGHTEDVALNLEGRKLMDQLRATLNVAMESSQRRSQTRTGRWHTKSRISFLSLGSLAVLVGVAIGLLMRRLLRQVTEAYRTTLDILQTRAEDAFRSEERLRATLASIGDGVITCDIQGCVDSMNAVAQELTGWSEEEACGQPLDTVLHMVQEGTRAHVESPIAKAHEVHGIAKLPSHTILIRRDGTEISIDDSGAPIRDRAGKTTGFVLVFRDVTLARKSQAALIANEKLAVSGRLAASIAHEIHNPLDSVSNLLYLMAEGPTPEESARFLELARQEISRVTQISRAMLGLYRESRVPVAVNLREILESILLLMDRHLAGQSIRVTTGFFEEAIVHGFPAELRQVFTNLLTNAAEAAGEGGAIHVHVTPAPPLDPTQNRHSGARSGFTITVSDSGPGIPEELSPQLFKPFFTTKGERGTGLGLWVSKGIITRHSGDITIESHTTPEDHGTAVHVFLAAEPIIQPAVT
jgi:PAS domain S-box-containing protein